MRQHERPLSPQRHDGGVSTHGGTESETGEANCCPYRVALHQAPRHKGQVEFAAPVHSEAFVFEPCRVRTPFVILSIPPER